MTCTQVLASVWALEMMTRAHCQHHTPHTCHKRCECLQMDGRNSPVLATLLAHIKDEQQEVGEGAVGQDGSSCR